MIHDDFQQGVKMRNKVSLDDVLKAFRRYCISNEMDGVDLWYWLNTHHVSLTVIGREEGEEE